MPADAVHVPVSIRPSALAGIGAFADAPCAAAAVVGAFAGRLVDRAGLDTLDPPARARGVQIDDDLWLVGEHDALNALNHSCAPNCELRGEVVVVARRPIAAGEELTIDYATRNGSDDDEFECNCRAPGCRGQVTGHDWMLPELHHRYGDAFSPYLRRRAASLVDGGASRRAFAY